ncbi:cytidine deaminase [Parasteatoda tepidariorum]|uniref:cytidine deaminase n=1 Tax=Parasteatoda tepidariorum TaxID=114398 RepID=UPI00077F8288|nr:cytidine deaminase [Parasteatoda tepidariorum]
MSSKSLSEDEYKNLFEICQSNLSNSYCPYSKFSVSAAILSEDDRVFTGVNIENASYGLTICAERSAIAKAVTDGCQKFKAIVIVCGSKSDEYIGPCGACRQVLVEFGTDWDVYLTKSDGTYTKCTVGDLLPFAFVPESLRKSYNH